VRPTLSCLAIADLLSPFLASFFISGVFRATAAWTPCDRLSRSLRDVLTIMERLADAKAGFRSLTEAVDTTTPAGRMMMQMVGAFAEFERAMLRERTKAGLDAARREGRIGGRRAKLISTQQKEVIRLVTKGRKTPADAARLFSVHPATISRLLQRTDTDRAKFQ
jgi:DNA invertase Pin-like site-specific DNA recombinase